MNTKFSELLKSIKIKEWPTDYRDRGVYFLEAFKKECKAITGIENIRFFFEIVDELFKSKTVQLRHTRKKIINVIEDGILEKVGEGIADYSKFKARIIKSLDGELKKYGFARNIYGIKTDKDLNLGEYRVKRDNYIREMKIIEPWVPHREKLLEGLGDYQLHISVESFSKERSVELCDEKMELFEDVVYFVAGSRNGSMEIRVVSPTVTQKLRYWEFENEVMVGDGSEFRDGVRRLVDMSNFNKPEVAKIFDGISCNLPIWERIKSSIKWFSKGIKARRGSLSVIYFCNSIECLLIRKSGSIMTPGVVYQFAESVAFALGDSYEDKCVIERDCKSIYEIRSRGVHSGEGEVSETTVSLACSYSRSFIDYYIDHIVENCRSDDDVFEYFRKLKFNASMA